MIARSTRLGRRLHHASFLQPRQPAFWLYALVVGLTAIVAIAEQSLYRNISPTGWALSWLLLALYGIPVVVVVYLLDLYEREPLSLVAAVFVWGAIAATTLSAIGNAGWGLALARVADPEFAARWTAALTAPFVEEILKGCGVVLIYLIARDEVDDVMDGFVYGAICGLGFAIVEDVFYFMAVFGGQPADVLEGFWVRVVASGLYGHVLYTGLVGMAIGVVVSRRATEPLRHRLWVAAGLSALAIFAHFLWNSPLLTFFPAEPWAGADYLLVVLATAVKGLPLLGFVALAVALARRREHRWLHDALAAEVGFDGISAGGAPPVGEPATAPHGPPRDATSGGSAGGDPALTAPARAGEPRDGRVQGRRRRRSGARPRNGPTAGRCATRSGRSPPRRRRATNCHADGG